MSTKQELVALMLQHGMSATDANIVADVSEHASVEAVATISRVCDTAPQGLRAPSMITAVRILVASLTQFAEEAEATLEAQKGAREEYMVIRFYPEVYQHYQTPMDAVGMIPNFFSAYDPRPVAEQIAENYQGGWRHMGGGKLDKETHVYHYPGDPPLKPLALMTCRDETVVVYDSGMTAIIQKDGSFEMSRLD